MNRCRDFDEFYVYSYREEFVDEAYSALENKDDWSEKEIRMGLKISAADWKKQKKKREDFVKKSINEDFGN